ncbi:Protein tyrosine phosphatase 10D, partial [Operophtera brumata]
MWKRSIVQATGGAAAVALALASLAPWRVRWLQCLWRGAAGAELVIEIPGSGAAEAERGSYRLDYRPPHGSPAPNFTVPARAATINFQIPGSGAAEAERGSYRLVYRQPHGSPAPNFTVPARAATITSRSVCANEIPGSGAAEAERGSYRLDYRPPHGSPAPNFTVPARAATITSRSVCANEIPGSGAAEAERGSYRLDYRRPHGSPAPNFTVPARAATINFQGLPGTKYHFMLYYSNATFADLLTWNQTIITAPEPPTNLTVTLGRSKQATIAWAPPALGDYTGFRFKVIALTERAEVAERNITVEAGAAGEWTHALRELAPGATYQLHAFTLLHGKESAAYASRNFTT